MATRIALLVATAAATLFAGELPPAPVPEPSSLLLVGGAAAAAFFIARKRKSNK